MKPRLQSAPLTREDWDIWDQVNWMWSPDNLLVWTYEASLRADRRDADLMLYLTSAHVDIRPGTEEKYRYVWRLSHAFQGIPTVRNEDVA
jgi:hypothetical protein